MKKFLFAWLCAGTVLMTACSSDGDQTGETPATEETVSQAADMHMAHEQARKALNDVYDRYQDVKDALVKSDATAAQSHAGGLANALTFDASTLTADEQSAWNTQKQALQSAAEKIAQTTDLKEQRTAFYDMSMAMEKSIAAIGLYDRTVYKQYCPMAFDDTGASWIASEEQVNNPYFGDEMLNCGSVEETMKY